MCGAWIAYYIFGKVYEYGDQEYNERILVAAVTMMCITGFFDLYAVRDLWRIQRKVVVSKNLIYISHDPNVNNEGAQPDSDEEDDEN